MNAISGRSIALSLYLAMLVVIAAPASIDASENPALWKYEVEGNFASMMEALKSGLEASQFNITGEENLSKALEKNKQIFGENKWNTIGFQDATAIHFCSLVFNQEVFNMNMDWSILCPFKVVAYTMKETPNKVTILLTRPRYLLEKDPDKRAKEMGGRIEDRIIGAIEEALSK